MKSAYHELNIQALRESAHNPRQHFNEAALVELTESILQSGIITPLIVRPLAQGEYEIAAGHRRYRAAKRAGLTTVPCTVREMDDQTFMEVLTIENLQREDVHPLDEAKGYEALMAAPYKMDVHKIAERVGRSVKYIYDRVKLLALTPAAQEFFWDGRIEAGHAILLARLTPSQQARVIGTADKDYEDGGLFETEHRLYDPEDKDRETPLKCRSVLELKDWINSHVRFDRTAVDPMLFPETAEKVAVAVQETKAKDLKKAVVPITYEYVLNDDTRDPKDRVLTERMWRRADGRHDTKTCEHAVMGCVVVGVHRGDAFEVCLAKKECAIHWAEEMKHARLNAASSNPASPANKKAAAEVARLRKKEEDERKALEARRLHWEKMQPRIDAVILERVKSINSVVSGPMADLLVEQVAFRLARKAPRLDRGKTAEDLVRYLVGIVLVSEAQGWRAHLEFPPVAKKLGIDLSPFIQMQSRAKAPAEKAKAKKAGKKKAT